MGVQGMGSSGKEEFSRWGVQEMDGINEMGSSGEEEFSRWGVQEMEVLRATVRSHWSLLYTLLVPPIERTWRLKV